MIITNIPTSTSISAINAKVDIQTESALVNCTCGDYLQDFVLHREGDTSKFFGFGVTHRVDANFIDVDRTLAKMQKGNELNISIGDGTHWDSPYPRMYVTELARNERTNNITCVAYDSLFKANAITVSELNIAYPSSVSTIATACANLLGLPLKWVGLNSSDISLVQEFDTLNFNGDEPLRLLLDAIAEFTQTIYYINSQNKLVFKRLDKNGNAVLTVTKELYFELTTLTPRTLTSLCHATELGDNLSTPEGTGTTQIMRNNVFYEMNPVNTAVWLQNAIDVVQGLTIHQLDCEWDGNHCLEIGDKVDFVTEDDNTVTTYIINDVIEYQGFINEITSWEYTQDEDATASNPTTIGEKITQTYAKVDKINKEITLLAQDVTDTASEMAELKLTTDGIGLRVEETYSKVTSTQSQVNNLQSTQTAMGTAISALQLQSNEIELRVEAVESKDLDLSEDEDFIALTKRVSTLEISDTEISAKVSATEEAVNSTNANVETLTNEVNLKMSAEDVTIAITNTLNEGIDKVVTSTKKYTFDDTGLNVRSSDNSISTTITEDGMSIERAGSEVLTANNEGVKAEDLHATTYLIIGNNSRLEDWQGNYTACFWIGD